MAADYLPIEDHAAIGNIRSVALVGRDGSIDRCPLPGLESASVFAAILDHRRGGRFQVRARGADVGTQAYIPHTNVLETSFDDGDGRLVVTDCMPIRGNLDGVGGSTAEPAVHRLLRAKGGEVEMRVEWSPRFRYGNGLPQMMPIDGGFLAWAGDESLTLSGVDQDEATTSLPEEIGGVRNWDYRYSWIRDSALAAQALHALGHDVEAQAFVEWAERVAREHRNEDRAIQIVYGLHGEAEIGEQELPNLEGYRRSAPVRIGNGAVDQLQLDVFGRTEEARELFERMVSHANHVGLYAEEIDPATGAFLGNFPQAFTHIGLINSALYLAYVEGRDSPVPDPIGSDEHREHRLDSARQSSGKPRRSSGRRPDRE